MKYKTVLLFEELFFIESFFPFKDTTNPAVFVYQASKRTESTRFCPKERICRQFVLICPFASQKANWLVGSFCNISKGFFFFSNSYLDMFYFLLI